MRCDHHDAADNHLRLIQTTFFCSSYFFRAASTHFPTSSFRGWPAILYDRIGPQYFFIWLKFLRKNISFNVKLFWIITTCCTDYNNHDSNYVINLTTCCVDWEARHSSPIWGSGDFTFDLKTIFSLPFLPFL